MSVSPTTTTTYTVTVTPPAGTAITQTTTVTVVPAPTITSFGASPATITVGGSSSLTAVFANGTGVITPGNLPATSGVAVTVSPTTTTTYTLTVTPSMGTAITQTATVTVVPLPTITSFGASPATITAGASSSLTAVFANGAGVITPGNLAVTSGTAVSVSPTTTTTYTVTVTPPTGTAITQTTTVTVVPAPTITSFSANPTTIEAGTSSNLTAVFSGGTGVITPGNLSVTSGTPVSVSPTTTTTYTLTVTPSTGTAITQTATVTVTPAPSITSFTANSTTIEAGMSSNLTAVFTGGTGVITPGNLSVTSGTPVSVSPTTTTTYTLTVTPSTGTAITQTATVTVSPAPSITNFIASPSTIVAGTSLSLTSVFAGGTGVITPGNFNVTSGAAVTVTPSATTTYTITVTPALGAAITQSLTVRVFATPPNIQAIAVTSPPILIFDHTKDQQQPLNIPDLPITAWKEADGTVNLMIPSYENYRMRGPDLLHLTMDPNEIFSSTQSASEITENLYDYHHWLTGPYSLDGTTFYSLAHSEWYACLLNANCDAPVTNGENALLNSWANTVNSFVSTDGGASWQLNVVDGNHAVVKWAYVWTGSVALADQVYLTALNHTGVFAPTRIIKEGSYYYSIGWYQQRDFTQINPPTNDQAPITSYGYIILRTSDFTDPNGWSAWTGGTNYESLASPTIESDVLTFLPQHGGTVVNAAPPQIIFDTVAQTYILIYTPYGTTPDSVYYITTKSLANPSWSNPTVLGISSLLTTDPGGPMVGFLSNNYPSILDNSSTGYNFEFTSGSPLLFWSTFPSYYGGNNLARDVYCVQLSVSYF